MVEWALRNREPGDPPLPAELQDALREWTDFAAAVTHGGRPDELELLRRRGRQLAGRVADVVGRPIEFVDPVSGGVESVRVGATGPIARPDADPAGPTPWATGLAVAGFCAVLVAVADVVLSRAFAEAFGLLSFPANLLVGVGLAPTLWLVRRMPFWRWPALGVTVGLGVAWLVLALDLLG